MFPQNCKVVSPETFDKLFSDEAIIADFTSSDEETAYERRDSFLIHLIGQQVQRQFGSSDTESLCVGDDWWPNQTRYITACPEHCTPKFLTGLRSLLADEYASYRIQICVYRSLAESDDYVGSMALYADRVVIETALFQLLKDKQVQ